MSRLVVLLGVASGVLGVGRCTRHFAPNGQTDASTRDAGTIDGGGASCGNGLLESRELCDGTNLGGQSCVALGYSGGVLGCDATCHFSTAGCEEAGQCTGQCASCAGQAEAQACEAESGCGWRAAGCVGACEACDGEPTAADCESRPGCAWHTDAACTGACTPCANLTSADACADQLGCGWEDAGCAGTPTPCANRSDAATCRDGCTWELAHCDGTSDCSILSQAECEHAAASEGCSWDGAACGSGAPFPGNVDCGTFDDDISLCQSASGCTWISTVCAGTPSACAGRSQSSCLRGCAWTGPHCDGACTACDTFTSQAFCDGAQGCGWTPVGETCQGPCTPCDTLDEASCGTQRGCSVSDAPACSGECTACSLLHNGEACRAQPGCVWTAAP